MRSGPVLEQHRDTRRQATARCIHPVRVTLQLSMFFREQAYLYVNPTIYNHFIVSLENLGQCIRVII